MKLAFFFDYSSPFAYLAATQVQALALKRSAELAWHPFLLGGLFRSIGTANVPLQSFPSAKQKHALADMKRWAEHYEQPFTFPTRFPMNTVTPLRMTLQLESEDRAKLALLIFRAYWAEDRDIGDRDVLEALADAAGFDGAALLEGCSDQAVKDALRHQTELAERLGICGAPSFVVTPPDEAIDGKDALLFWGQDRLLFVDKALAGWRPRCG